MCFLSLAVSLCISVKKKVFTETEVQGPVKLLMCKCMGIRVCVETGKIVNLFTNSQSKSK